jgi:type IV pilus assembly protein PilQ
MVRWWVGVALALHGCALPAAPLTLNLVRVPVRPALKLIGDVAGVNVVVSDAVAGDVTLNLHDVDWQHALELIARMRDLVVRREQNLIWVTTVAENAQAAERAQQRAPITHASVALSFAKAADLAKMLAGDATRNAFMSPNGRALADERSNTLVLADTPQKLAQLKPLLAFLDRPSRQVLIEARVVVASAQFRRSLDSRWGARATRGNTTLNTGTRNHPYTQNLPSAGAGGAAGRWGVSILGRQFAADLELGVAQVEGQVRHVASPRVIVGDHAEAVIRQGKELAYRSAVTGTDVNPTMQFKRAELALRVTPSIMANGKVQLRIELINDSLADPTRTGGVPRVDTHGLTTTVIVGDGETAVVGGVDGSAYTTGATRVPWFGAVPGLGALFRSGQRRRVNEELLLFIRPSILADSAAAAKPSVSIRPAPF